MRASRHNKGLTFAIVGLFFVSLIWLVRWPLWASIVLALVLAMAIPGMERLLHWFRQPKEPAPVIDPLPPPTYTPPPPPPVQTREESIAGVRLPSRDADYDFIFSAQVVWRSPQSAMNDRSVNLGALAVDSALQRARRVTEQSGPGQVSLVRHELGRALADMQGDTTGRVRVMANSVQLELPPEDQDRLDKLASFRKDSALWEQERNYERSKREYLGSDALKNPGSAVVWWLARNDERIDKTVEDIGLLTRLTAAANNTGISVAAEPIKPEDLPGPPMDFTGWTDVQESAGERRPIDLFASFLSAVNLTDANPERTLFARRVAALIARLDHSELAEEMIRRFVTSNGVEHPREANGVGYPEADGRSPENRTFTAGEEESPAAGSNGLGYPPEGGPDDERYGKDEDGD